MSISGALNNALTGLTASARTAEVVSSNLSNALTEGYARRGVSLSSVQVGNLGGGVRIDGITRFVDAGLIADRRLADAALNGQERTADFLVRLEQSIGPAGDAGNLVARLAAVEASLIRASADPMSEPRLNSVATSLEDLVLAIRQNDDTIQQLRQEADRTIARDVDTLNTTLVRLEELNGDIVRLANSGNDISALLDARQREVDRIAGLVPIRETVKQDGSIRLMTTSGLTLLDGRAVTFEYAPTPTITGDMTLSSGALSGILLDGQPLDADNGVGRLDGGAIGAAFAMRDQTLPEVQSALDTFAADLIARFQDPANDPTIATGGAGLLTDEGGPLDQTDIPGLAGRITLNAAISIADGGLASRIRDGLNAPIAGPNGDVSQINRWIDALAAPRSDLTGAANQSAPVRASAFIAQIGATRFEAEASAGFSTARWEVLKQAELADGVDTDRELQTLIQVEQYYAANAKVIETVDFLMRRLMEI